MDRQIIYPGQIPLDTDQLLQSRNTMVAMAKLAAAVLGTATQFNGLTVTQTTVASMQVQVAPGEIYMLANLDGSAYSSLAADTTHQILKQGINLDATLLTLSAPGTAGQSVNYLIQATLTESDGSSTVLPYYDSGNPGVAYSGPSNTGASQSTARKCVVTLSAKAGTPATTGTQTTPSPDTGYVGLGVVTVAFGQSSITSANISAYSGTPAISTIAAAAAAALSSAQASQIGIGQTVQNVSGSRAIGTTYYNTTARPILVNINVLSTIATTAFLGISGGASYWGSNAVNQTMTVVGIVPPGGNYTLTVGAGTPTLQTWTELR